MPSPPFETTKRAQDFPDIKGEGALAQKGIKKPTRKSGDVRTIHTNLPLTFRPRSYV
jgi:hypothetical protein